MQVNYRWETHPNPDIQTLHTDKRIPDMTYTPDSTSDLQSLLMQIHGVESAYSSGRYAISVIRGKMFDWAEIRKAVENVLTEHMGFEFPGPTPA